jgi:hypothetical protein
VKEEERFRREGEYGREVVKGEERERWNKK